MANTGYDVSPGAIWRNGLSRREQRFVENFTMTVTSGDSYWRDNLELDLDLYRYPHTAKVRAAVVKLMRAKEAK